MTKPILDLNTTFSPSELKRLAPDGIATTGGAWVDVHRRATVMTIPGVITGGLWNVPRLATIQATQVDPTSFETSGDTLQNAQVTMNLYSDQWGLNATHQDAGLSWAMQFQSHRNALTATTELILNSKVTSGNFGSADVTVSSSAFALADCETLLSSVPASTVLALTSPYFNKVKSTWLPAGKESLLAEWDSAGAGTNITGFVAQPTALAVIVGYPSPGPAGQVETSMVKLGNGLDAQLSLWFALGGRQIRASLDIALGVELGQVASLGFMQSA